MQKIIIGFLSIITVLLFLICVSNFVGSNRYVLLTKSVLGTFDKQTGKLYVWGKEEKDIVCLNFIKGERTFISIKTLKNKDTSIDRLPPLDFTDDNSS